MVRDVLRDARGRWTLPAVSANDGCERL